MLVLKSGMENISANSGMVTFVVGIIIVFVTLTVLFLSFKYASKLFSANLKGKTKSGESKEMTAAENAAIATALYLYMSEEQHIEESGVITIEKRVNKYSPWSSKLQTLGRAPRQ